MSLWPFHSSGRRVQDLTAAELAAIATSKLQTLGRNTLSSRLLYRALSLNPFQLQALLMLSELYRGKTKGMRPLGDEFYAGIILEFATGEQSPLTAEEKRFFDKSRMDLMTLWGFTKLRGGDMDVDHLGYMTFVNECRFQVQSFERGFGMALLKIGIQTGLLDATTGKETRVYTDWLRSDASTLQS